MEANKEIKEDVIPEKSTGRNNRRPGKGSQQRNMQKFRERKNAQAEEKRLTDIANKYKLFEYDETKQLEAVANTVQITAQKKAVPLSVTTRGVGFGTAIFYDRACSTWTQQAISEIATIHQVYRVHLWMVHYKVFLAQQIQAEVVFQPALRRIFINDEMREILQTIMEVPSLVSLVLSSIGKIESNGKVYHLGYAENPAGAADILEYSTVCPNPDNLRDIIDTLSNAGTPLAERQEYHRYNSIPGVHVVDGFVTNADQVYPLNYGANELRADVHAYKNLLTRIQPRLPKHSILQLSWSGRAALSGLWSCARSETSLVSYFQAQQVIRDQPRRRDAAGQLYEAQLVARGEGFRYQRSEFISERTNYWSIEETPHLPSVVGIASMVGEECFIHSRYELVAHSVISNTALTLMYAFSDAPR